MLVVTCATASYLPQAAHLSYTARHHRVADRVVLCLLERKKVLYGLDRWFDVVFTPDELLGQGAGDFMFRHDACEAACALKARTLLAAMETPGADHVLWLDPDVWVLGEFREVLQALNVHPVILTPHVLLTEGTADVLGSDVFSILKAGVFNLGFVGLRRSAEARLLLGWWRDWVERWCRLDTARGIFMDQRWMDLAMSGGFVGSLTAKGYNVNRTNLRFRPIRRADGAYRAGPEPLRFMHFCGFGRTARPEALFDGAGGHAPTLLRRYKRRLNHFGWTALKTAGWSYDRFDSGEPIDFALRRRYSTCELEHRPRGGDPFTLSNDVIARRLPPQGTDASDPARGPEPR